MNLDKQKLQIASANHSKLDVSSTHITSASWLQPQPVFYRHMLPKEHLKGSANVLSRLAPVAVPTYGRCRINLRGFFVPFRTVFPNFTEFMVDTIGSNYANSSLITDSPTIDNAEIVGLFLSANNYAITTTGNIFDFKIGTTKYILGKDGRALKKMLDSLGYKIVWSTTKGLLIWSALPILCYAKIYFDWYANSAYMDSAAYLYIARLFKYNDPTGNLVMTQSMLEHIWMFTEQVCYDECKTVYLNAWDNPVAPNAGLYSSGLGAVDITAVSNAATINLDSNGTPTMNQASASSMSVGTQYIHTMLRAMTDFIKRNQLAGSRQIDRFLARFGINLDSAKVDRSVYISSQSIDIDFGSVTSNANTAAAGNPSNLGDYAGMGLGRGQFGFDYQADEFGMFIVISTIVPAAELYQGFDRNNLHIKKLDFFQPEFDNLGVQGISKGEVYVSVDGNYGTPADYLGTFGYAPRFYEYKQKQDFVTGDLVSPPTMAGGNSWHLMRELDDQTFGTIASQTHSLGFTRANVDWLSYDRIFQSTDSSVDKFYLVYHFAAEALAPCKSLFDTYDFEDAGKQITMQSNGTKLN